MHYANLEYGILYGIGFLSTTPPTVGWVGMWLGGWMGGCSLGKYFDS